LSGNTGVPAGGGVIMPVGVLKPEMEIALAVKGSLILIPVDNVPEPLATVSAHMPLLAEPVVTILAQLLLLQSAFSSQRPPISRKDQQTPSFTLAMKHTPALHWLFEVQGKVAVPEESPVCGGGVCPDEAHEAVHLARHALHALVPVLEPLPAFACDLAHTLLVQLSPAAHGRFAEHASPRAFPAEGSFNVPVDVLKPGMEIALAVGIFSPFKVRVLDELAGVSAAGVAVVVTAVGVGLCAHLHTQFPFGQSLWDTHAAPGLFCPAPVFVIV